MSSDTLRSIQRLMTALREADEVTRYMFAFFVISLLMMATAIVAQFGWNGFLFCFGLLMYRAVEEGNKHR